MGWSTDSFGRASVGRYQLLRRIGQGGMAEVYLGVAQDANQFRRLVALKVVLPHLREEPEFARMFLREAAIAARFDHPNVVQVLDFGSTDGEQYLAMEYVHGRTVRDVLSAAARGDGLPLPAALTLVRDVAAALHHAHEARDTDGRPLGVVHRDVSPSNVIIRYDGVVKLADFGVAKATKSVQTTVAGCFKGKIGYMSPEQCRGESLDRRTDIFSLGVLLYETTLGRRLYPAINQFKVLGRVLRGEFERPREIQPDYPVALERIVLSALATDPAQRFPSAAEVANAIEWFALEAGLVLSPATVARAMDRLFPLDNRDATQLASDDEFGVVDSVSDPELPREPVTAPMDLAVSEAAAVDRRRTGRASPWGAAVAGASIASGLFGATLYFAMPTLRSTMRSSSAATQTIGVEGPAAALAFLQLPGAIDREARRAEFLAERAAREDATIEAVAARLRTLARAEARARREARQRAKDFIPPPEEPPIVEPSNTTKSRAAARRRKARRAGKRSQRRGWSESLDEVRPFRGGG